MATSDDTPSAKLDHIVILVPYKALSERPQWLTDLFHISAGGRHRDNKTENRLILFPDGSYLELIAFIDDDPKHKEGHWWGEGQLGSIIDIAFTSSEDGVKHYEKLHERVSGLDQDELKIDFVEPRTGGRETEIKTESGIERKRIEWVVTFPTNVRRGVVPFFCHDTTPRRWRVPISEESVVHASHASGVKDLTFSVNDDRLVNLSKVWSAALGVEAKEEQPSGNGPKAFTLTCGKVGSLSGPAEHVRIRLQGPQNEDERRELQQRPVIISNLVIGSRGAERELTLFKHGQPDGQW